MYFPIHYIKSLTEQIYHPWLNDHRISKVYFPSISSKRCSCIDFWFPVFWNLILRGRNSGFGHFSPCLGNSGRGVGFPGNLRAFLDWNLLWGIGLVVTQIGLELFQFLDFFGEDHAWFVYFLEKSKMDGF